MAGIRFVDSEAQVDPAAVEALGGHDAAAAAVATTAADEAQRRWDKLEAVRLRSRAVLLDPNYADEMEQLGVSLLIAGRVHQEATAVFRTAVRVDPALREARYRLGMCLQQSGELEPAREQWRELVRRSPEHSNGHARLAVVEYLLENDAAAWEHVHAAERLDGSVPAHFRVNLAERTPGTP